MIIDKSLNFGMQNFFFVKSDETDVTYDYVGFMNRKGSILIMRLDKAGENALYYIGTGVFATVFGLRATFTYVTPDALIDPQV